MEKKLRLEEVMLAQHQLQEADKNLRAKVTAANNAGCSWAEIGRALGSARQTAWERFGKKSRPPDLNE